ncbi:ankyrin repeat protein, partial [Zopfia rhizophila CBS 207.26]
GRTALFRAVESSQLDVVKVLLEHAPRVDVDRPIAGRFTPLVIAIMKNGVETVKLLLDFGANVDLKGTGQKTALLYVAEVGDAKVLEMLL